MQTIIMQNALFIMHYNNVLAPCIVHNTTNCAKGAGPSQYIYKPSLVCQPIGTEVFCEDILLFVDAQGLACKYAGQALAKGNCPTPFQKLQLNWPRRLCNA